MRNIRTQNNAIQNKYKKKILNKIIDSTLIACRDFLNSGTVLNQWH